MTAASHAMHDYAHLDVTVAGHVAEVTIANPPANVWTRESLKSLARLVHDLEARNDVTALLITGAGDKFFSAGADLKVFVEGGKTTAREMADAFGEAFEALAAFRGVSIAAINGYAMGGGLECALACDLRIADERAQLALPEASVGLLPCGGGTQNLTRLVGEGWAKRLILCGERVDAATALRIGLVEDTAPAGEAMKRARAWAERVAKQSPSSIAACKQLLQRARTEHATLLLPRERDAFVALFDTADQKEGVAAFLEKRAPQWKNA